MEEISYETLKKIIPAYWIRSLKREVGKKSPGAVTETGIKDYAFVAYMAVRYESLSAFSEEHVSEKATNTRLAMLLSLREKLATYCSPESCNEFDRLVEWDLIAERFSDAIAGKERRKGIKLAGSYNQGDGTSGRGTGLEQLAILPAYTAEDLLRYGIATVNVLLHLQNKDWESFRSISMPRVWWGLKLAKAGRFDILVELGFTKGQRDEVDLHSLESILNASTEAAALSEEEREVIGTLEKGDMFPLAGDVTRFYAHGKHFMKYPVITLLWVVAKAADVTTLRSEINKKIYMVKFADWLAKYGLALEQNARIFRESTETMLATAPADVVSFFGDALNLDVYR